MTAKKPRVAHVDDLPWREGTFYPPPMDADVAGRRSKALGNAVGISHYGVRLVEVPPGSWSSQRHWHEKQDEFMYMLTGELTLVTDAGETLLTPGMIAGFPAGDPDGHHVINKTNALATFLVVGDRVQPEVVHYPDRDMLNLESDYGEVITDRAGRPLRTYPKERPR